MKTRVVPQLALITVMLFASAGMVPASAQAHKYLFNMSMNGGVVADWHPEPWPAVPFGGVRLWNTGTTWADLNPSRGVYDWTKLDKWLAAAAQNNHNVLYTFAGVPQWASSNPDDSTCMQQPGACDPPNDLNADGSGPDQHWKDFVTALVEHSNNSSTRHIAHWEMWNEPMHPFYWNGTYPQLIRMVSDAYAIIKTTNPTDIVLTPAFGWQSTATTAWMGGYFAAGGGQYADRISVHGYSKGPNGTYGPPENMVRYLANFRAVLNQHGLQSMPIWDTEANWGCDLVNDPDMQAAWVARFFVLHAANQIRRLYWFIWNGADQGGMWKPDPVDHRLPGTILKPGIAYAQVGSWLVGASTSSCQQDGTIWTCAANRDGGYKGLIVWDTSQTCESGECSTTEYRFHGKFRNYRTIDNSKEIRISGDTVVIGAKPILLQNR
jgi:hypothetical protein